MANHKPFFCIYGFYGMRHQFLGLLRQQGHLYRATFFEGEPD